MEISNTLKIGAHVSIAGGYTKVLERIKGMRGNCLQIFSSSPRSWMQPEISEEKRLEFLKYKKELEIDPVYFHASYLVNLADTGHIGNLSKTSLIKDMQTASELGIKGVIVHTGSFKNGTKEQPYTYTLVTKEKYDLLLFNIKEVLEASPKDVYLILENSGTRKIGWDIKELAIIIKSISDPRLKICLDTCHLHAAGFDLTTPDAFNNFLDLFDKEIGLSNLELFHVNDSKDALKSFRDRHENIGKGNVGAGVFYNLLHSKRTRNLPFIIEVPGIEGKGPDKENIEIVRQIAQSDEK